MPLVNTSRVVDASHPETPKAVTVQSMRLASVTISLTAVLVQATVPRTRQFFRQKAHTTRMNCRGVSKTSSNMAASALLAGRHKMPESIAGDFCWHDKVAVSFMSLLQVPTSILHGKFSFNIQRQYCCRKCWTEHQHAGHTGQWHSAVPIASCSQ